MFSHKLVGQAIMKTQISATFDSTLDEVAAAGRDKGLVGRSMWQEVLDTIDVLKTWRDVFSAAHGDLEYLTHHSNPDDPPDVLATFKGGVLAVEHTIVEPPHIMMAEAIHRKERSAQARYGVPLSVPYKAQELREIMWTKGNPKSWEATPAHYDARHDLIVSAIDKKIEKYPPGGLLLMRGEIGSFPSTREWDFQVVAHALKEASKLPGADRWQFAVHFRWNSMQSFSVLCDSQRQCGYRVQDLIVD